MTNQEFFTKSVTHVMQQKQKCMNARTCAYAGPDGTSCAVGVCMPREMAEAADALHNSDIASVLNELPEAVELFKGVSLKLLDACQITHDTTTARTEEAKRVLRNKFLSVAEEFGLEMPNV